MRGRYSTTQDIFPVRDITHRPKRMQSDNLKRAAINSKEEEEEVVTIGEKSNDILKVLTLERAIVFYEANATGEFEKLYIQTAKWLRELLNRSVSIPEPTVIGVDLREPSEEDLIEEEEEEVSQDDEAFI